MHPVFKTLLLPFLLLTLPTHAEDGQPANRFQLVPPAAPPQAEAAAQPATERVRLDPISPEEAEEEAEAGDMTREEIAAMQLALEGEGARRAGGNLILPGMEIRVSVLVQGQSEIRTEPQRINETGRIGLPLVQNVQVANQSIEEIEAQLTGLYNEYFRDPHVIVEFVGSTADPYMSPWGFVTLIGRVGHEGPVAVPPTRNMTLSGAIKSAGGMASSANSSSITVFRPDLENNRVERISIDLRNVGRRGNHEDDIRLQAGDVIFVPERIF